MIKDRNLIKTLELWLSNFINNVYLRHCHQLKHCSTLFKVFRKFYIFNFLFCCKITSLLQAWCRRRSVVVCLEQRVFLVNLGGWSATMFWLFNSLDGCLLSCSLEGYCISVYYYIWLLWGFQGHCAGYILGNLGSGYLTHEKKVPQ